MKGLQPMTVEVTIAILFAALLHAGWNALIKVQGDRLAVMATFSLFGSLFSLFFCAFYFFSILLQLALAGDHYYSAHRLPSVSRCSL